MTSGVPEVQGLDLSMVIDRLTTYFHCMCLNLCSLLATPNPALEPTAHQRRWWVSAPLRAAAAAQRER
jgi:hypothetical protein